MAKANNLVAHIANEFISGNTDEVVDIITFVEAPWGLSIRLLPVQRFILKAYYGMALNDTDKTITVPDLTNERTLYIFTEQEFLQWLYDEGRCNTNTVEGKQFREICLVIGRRGGKSTLAACISNYELYKLVKRGDPSKYYGMPPQTAITVLNVAPTDDQADIVFDMIKGQAMRSPYLGDRSLHQTMQYFDLQTDDDRKMRGRPKASLVSIAGGCSANSLRGRNAIVIVMDEMAFFIDNGGRFSGDEVYRALTPSTTSFQGDGKIVSISSPYAKFGKFYELFHQSFDSPDYTLMFKMYSPLVNPTIPSDDLKVARRRDRVSFMSEYGAEFSDSVVAWIDDETEFKKCVTARQAPSRGVQEVRYFYGMDLGFKNDGTSLAICHKEGKKVVLDYANVWFSASSDVWEIEDSIYKRCNKYADQELLSMSDIVTKEIKELARWFPISAGTFDQHNGYALAELLHKEGFKQFEMEHFTDIKNSDIFKLAKRLYAEGLLDLFDHPVLIPELLTLEAERKTTRGGRKDSESSPGKITVRAPNRKGAHDDISDALVRAIWLCNQQTAAKPANRATGVGGSVGPGPIQKGQNTQTQASFFLQKKKQHGEHPRGHYKTRRRRPGAVHMK